MQKLVKSKLLENGHIRIVSTTGSTMTIDRNNNNNTYDVYGDFYGSTTNNTMDLAIQQVFSHMSNISKII